MILYEYRTGDSYGKYLLSDRPGGLAFIYISSSHSVFQLSFASKL